MIYGFDLERKLSALQPSSPTVRRLNIVGAAIIDWATYVMLIVVVLLGSCYPFARAYVLVESFVGLRSVDERAYEVVQWTAWWPHA
jgi:hypothetical protein